MKISYSWFRKRIKNIIFIFFNGNELVSPNNLLKDRIYRDLHLHKWGMRCEHPAVFENSAIVSNFGRLHERINRMPDGISLPSENDGLECLFLCIFQITSARYTR